MQIHKSSDGDSDPWEHWEPRAIVLVLFVTPAILTLLYIQGNPEDVWRAHRVAAISATICSILAGGFLGFNTADTRQHGFLRSLILTPLILIACLPLSLLFSVIATIFASD